MYAIVDIETTGGSPAYHRITEICIIIHDGTQITNRLHALINPERYIPSSISLLTGITNEMVADAPKFYEVANEIHQITENCIFVAHSVAFDFNFIKKEFEALGKEFNRKKLCTVRLSRKIFPGYPSYSLGNLCSCLGIPVYNRHRANGDAEATAILFSKLLEKDTENFISFSLKRNSKETFVPPHVQKEAFEKLPETTGVYYFHDEKGKVLYVGKALNIRDRVRQHFGGNTNTQTRQRFLDSIHDVTYEETGHELLALLLENESIKKHYPRYNKANKSFNLNFGIYGYEDQIGYMRLSIAKAGKHDKPLLTFKTYSEATAHIILKVKEHNLCLRLCGLLGAGVFCSNHDVWECKACHHNLNVLAYNKLFQSAFAQKSEERSFVIKTKGRTTDEEGFVWVEKGRFLGYGYISSDVEIREVETLKDHIKACYDTQDSQSIIQTYLKKSRLVKEGNPHIYAV